MSVFEKLFGSRGSPAVPAPTPAPTRRKKAVRIVPIANIQEFNYENAPAAVIRHPAYSEALANEGTAPSRIDSLDPEWSAEADKLFLQAKRNAKKRINYEPSPKSIDEAYTRGARNMKKAIEIAMAEGQMGGGTRRRRQRQRPRRSKAAGRSRRVRRRAALKSVQ